MTQSDGRRTRRCDDRCSHAAPRGLSPDANHLSVACRLMGPVRECDSRGHADGEHVPARRWAGGRPSQVSGPALREHPRPSLPVSRLRCRDTRRPRAHSGSPWVGGAELWRRPEQVEAAGSSPARALSRRARGRSWPAPERRVRLRPLPEIDRETDPAGTLRRAERDEGLADRVAVYSCAPETPRSRRLPRGRRQIRDSESPASAARKTIFQRPRLDPSPQLPQSTHTTNEDYHTVAEYGRHAVMLKLTLSDIRNISPPTPPA
jgi:hypothetical protein